MSILHCKQQSNPSDTTAQVREADITPCTKLCDRAAAALRTQLTTYPTRYRLALLAGLIIVALLCLFAASSAIVAVSVLALSAVLSALAGAIFVASAGSTLPANSGDDGDALLAKYEALRERYDLVTTNIAASVVIHNADGVVVLCSPYSQVLTGYTPAEIDSLDAEGIDIFESLVIDEDKERYLRAKHVSRLGEDILVRYRVRHRSGLRLWLETRMVPVVDDEGETVSTMSVTIDVTDSLTYQEQIEEQNRDLSDFTYMVSHDLKAPIFTIKGMTNALFEDYGTKLDDDARELLRFILDGADRLEALVASVIEYSSVATKEASRSEVDLGTTIEHVKADLKELIREKDAIITIGSSELPVVIGDSIRIYQVFSNLIGNALKYSSPERRPDIAVSFHRANSDMVVIDVKDNGLGVPPDRLEDIFRPYHRAHGSEIEGNGIGLACVKKIVERSGGTVSVESTLGEGSIFSVSFPARPTEPRAVPPDLARLF